MGKALFLLYIHINQKNKIMKFQLSVLTERLKPLVQELTDHITVLSEHEEFTLVEITVEGSLDLLCIFHAGIKAGTGYYDREAK